MDYQTRICKEYLRGYDKPKRPKRTLEELSANFDLQERIRLQMGYHPRNKEETLNYGKRTSNTTDGP